MCTLIRKQTHKRMLVCERVCARNPYTLPHVLKKIVLERTQIMTWVETLFEEVGFEVRHRRRLAGFRGDRKRFRRSDPGSRENNSPPPPINLHTSLSTFCGIKMVPIIVSYSLIVDGFLFVLFVCLFLKLDVNVSVSDRSGHITPKREGKFPYVQQIVSSCKRRIFIGVYAWNNCAVDILWAVSNVLCAG